MRTMGSGSENHKILRTSYLEAPLLCVPGPCTRTFGDELWLRWDIGSLLHENTLSKLRSLYPELTLRWEGQAKTRCLFSSRSRAHRATRTRSSPPQTRTIAFLSKWAFQIRYPHRRGSWKSGHSKRGCENNCIVQISSRCRQGGSGLKNQKILRLSSMDVPEAHFCGKAWPILS